MNFEDNISDQIDSYLNGLMTEEEHIRFEEQIEQNARLSDKVNEARLVNDAIYYASLAEMKSTISEDLKNIDYKPDTNWNNILYVSSALLLIVGVSIYYINSTTPQKIESKNKISIHNTELKTTNKIVVAESKDIINKKTTLKEHTQTPTSTVNTSSTEVESNNPQSNKNSTNTTQSLIKDSINNSKLVVEHTSKTVNEICNKTFVIKTSPSCNNKSTGQINIESDKSVTYNFHLNDSKIKGHFAIFNELSTGNYMLHITYGNHCEYSEKITIIDKWCGLNEAYSFNPDYNEKWTLNYDQGSSGTYTIYDPTGNSIYIDTFGTGISEWTGINRQGTTLEAGVYIAIINYSDGRKERVELTIIR